MPLKVYLLLVINQFAMKDKKEIAFIILIV